MEYPDTPNPLLPRELKPESTRTLLNRARAILCETTLYELWDSLDSAFISTQEEQNCKESLDALKRQHRETADLLFYTEKQVKKWKLDLLMLPGAAVELTWLYARIEQAIANLETKKDQETTPEWFASINEKLQELSYYFNDLITMQKNLLKLLLIPPFQSP